MRWGSGPVLQITRFVVAGLLLATRPSFASADVYQLFNGGKIEGDLLNPDESPRKTYVFRTKSGTVTLAANQVSGKVSKSADALWYDEHRGAFADDVSGQLAIAAECANRKLESQRVFHLEQVVKLDPENETARRQLGYVRLDGAWVKLDVWHRERGFVKSGGKWRLPQEVALEKAESERKDAEIQWTKQIRMWRQWIVKNAERAADGIAAIRAIEDPAAATPLIELLRDKKEPAELRKMYVDVLGKMPGAAVSSALTERALADPDPLVRDKALDQLVARDDKLAAQLLIGVVVKFSEGTTPTEQNTLLNLAAAGLGRLKAEQATVPLINALVTRHKEAVGGGGGNLNPTFTNDPNSGGGGLSFGSGGPKAVTRDVSNATVRDALIAIHSGVNHGFNKQAWRNWYEQMRAPVVVDLRRDR